jgi:hypothetical protein
MRNLVEESLKFLANRVNSLVVGAQGRKVGRRLGSYDGKASSIVTPENIDEYMEFLRKYSFVSSILKIFASAINDIISNTNFSISLDKKFESHYKSVEDDCNNFLREANLNSMIREDLEDILYYGGKLYYLDIDNKSLSPVENSQEFCIVQKRGSVKGYYYQDSIYIPSTKAVGYWLGKSDVQAIPENKIGSNSLSKATSVEDVVVNWVYFYPEGMFHNQIPKIFERYVKEFVRNFLSLKDTVRPDILSLNSQTNRQNLAEMSAITSRIESSLNGPIGFGELTSPGNFLNEVYYNLSNSIRVLPGLQGFSDLTNLGLPDLVEKRRLNNDEIGELTTEIISAFGIPEELYSGASGNKWEVISRSSRFLSSVNLITSSLTDFAKCIAISYIKSKYNVSFTKDDISCSVEIGNFISHFDIKSSLDNLNERTDQLTTISRNITELTAPPEQGGTGVSNFNPDKLKEYFYAQLKSIDEKLAETFNFIPKEEVEAAAKMQAHPATGIQEDKG